MPTNAQRKLLKVHDHLISMSRWAQELYDKPMSVCEQVEALKRLKQHASYAAARFGDIVSQEVSVIDRMEIEYEPYAKQLNR